MSDTMWYRKSKRKERRKKIDGIHMQQNISESTGYDKPEEEHTFITIR